MTAYDEDLARIHDQGFTAVAEGAAAFVLGMLEPGSTVVELGCGSGVTARRLTDAGHAVVGIDQSPALIALARERAPRAQLRVGSFVSEPLPQCDAVLAIGEVLNYLFDEGNTRAALPRLFARIHAALHPGGVFVFDLAGPRGGPIARTWSTGDDWAVLADAAVEGDILTRAITTFRQHGATWRRSEEVHRQRLYRPGEILPLLRAAGLRPRTLRAYGEVSPGPGRHVYVAHKPAVVLRGPQPGDLGWIVERHGALYAQEHGWHARMEGLVARVVAAFAEENDPAREAVWIAEVDGRRVGSIMCVDQGDGVAQLRLLLVEPSARGLGVGARLVQECLRFARDAGYVELRLWTNAVLHAARRIYERAGFTLVEEEHRPGLGPDEVFQTWARPL